MRTFHRAAAIASGYGFIAATAWHVLVVAGRELPGGFWGVLLAGAFVVWFIAILAILPLRAQLRGVGGLQFWKILFVGAPLWMCGVALLALGYAVVNFALATGWPVGRVTDEDPGFQRVGSGHVMAFYAAAMTILYGSANRADPPRCHNGHRLQPGQETCGACGAALIGPPARESVRT